MTSYQAQVLHEYTAQDDNQLTVQPGEIVTILDDSETLHGWALAQKGDHDGYVPASYVRSIENNNAPAYIHGNYNEMTEDWQPSGFQSIYETVLSAEHHSSFFSKLRQSVRDVLIPCHGHRSNYIMQSRDTRRSAILTLIFGFILCAFDALSILAPILPFGSDEEEKTSTGQILVFLTNFLCRMILTFVFIAKYPRPSLNFTTFPLLNVVASLTFGVRIYESLELGDNSEYDGYRYYRSWMWSVIVNVPFQIIALVLVIMPHNGRGPIVVPILVLVGNLLNCCRCSLASWARKETGNEYHADFEQTIKQLKL
mmetsp:Transcript_45746/g.76080  ORF Transcript_45746/g.76080 Transcript_45746/m.76080 type:complete len:312 (-) Transcript_45746:85-1020(-)